MKNVRMADLEVMAKALDVPVYKVLDEIVADEVKKKGKKNLDKPKK